MKLPPDREDAVSGAVREIGRKWQDAALAGDTIELRKRLGLIYWAIHEATEALNRAEKLTRAEALQHVEGRAA